MFIICFTAIRSSCHKINQIRYLTLKIQGQGHGQGQTQWSHLGPRIQSICLLIVSWQSDNFWMRYSKFYNWPWKFKVTITTKIDQNLIIANIFKMSTWILINKISFLFSIFCHLGQPIWEPMTQQNFTLWYGMVVWGLMGVKHFPPFPSILVKSEMHHLWPILYNLSHTSGFWELMVWYNDIVLSIDGEHWFLI